MRYAKRIRCDVSETLPDSARVNIAMMVGESMILMPDTGKIYIFSDGLCYRLDIFEYE